MSPRPKSSARAKTSGPSAPFADVLCAVNGSRGSREATRQALALAAPDAALTFIAVSQTRGVGLVAQSDLSATRAEAALEQAARAARKAGISAATELRKGAAAGEILVRAARRHDLMVLGSTGGPRVAGILLGSTATRAAHKTGRALLVARPTRRRGGFPESILLASDGSAGSWAAARATSRIARACGSRVQVLYVPQEIDPNRRKAINRQAAAIEKAAGAKPAITDSLGHVAADIVDTAREGDFSLIVIGRRGLAGIRALGSVSERVAHGAPCSVLVVPAEEGG